MRAVPVLLSTSVTKASTLSVWRPVKNATGLPASGAVGSAAISRATAGLSDSVLTEAASRAPCIRTWNASMTRASTLSTTPVNCAHFAFTIRLYKYGHHKASALGSYNLVAEFSIYQPKSKLVSMATQC